MTKTDLIFYNNSFCLGYFVHFYVQNKNKFLEDKNSSALL